MNREEKAAAAEALGAAFGAAKAAVLMDFRGLSVADMTALRRHLRKASVEYKVVKNTLAVRALGAGVMKGLAPYFEGPTAVAMSRTDSLAPARALMAWSKGRPTSAVKAGVVEGVVVGPAEIAAVAALPGREVLLSRMLGVFQAPLRNLASVLHAQVRGLATLLHQLLQQIPRGGSSMAKVSVDDVLESIDAWTVLDLNRLVKGIEGKYGVTAAAPVAVAAGPAAPAGAAAPAAEEKTEFTVVLAAVGPNKIQVIKEVRAMTSLGLKEAKDLVEGAPKPVKEGISKAEAEELKAKLEATGAKVELK